MMLTQVNAMNPAGANLVACIQSLAGHEYYVGQYYYKRQYYKAALHRFQSLISDYPHVGMHKQALEYIIQCEEALKIKEAEEKSDPEKKPVKEVEKS